MPNMLELLRLPGFEHVYWLGGEIRPGSVRDSIWRAGYAIDLLVKTRKISRGKRVLVVGAGVSGMSAAAHAIYGEADVTLCEMRSEVYSPFEKCIVRKICPTTFDYPQNHWNEYHYPHVKSGQRQLFEWDADIASGVFTQIKDQFPKLVKNGPGTFYPAYSSVVETLYENETLDAITVKLKDAVEQQFDVVVFATGIGALHRKIKKTSRFEGFAYFDNDAIFPTLDETEVDNGGSRILLVGGGDGSLSDFVRLLTGKIDINPSLSDLGLSKTAIKDLQKISKRMWREFNAGPSSIHPLFDRLQLRMIRYIDRLWEDPSVQQKVGDLIISDSKRRPAVQVAVFCCHFGFAYLANRVIAQLLARHLALNLEAENGGLYPFRIGVEAANVVSGVPVSVHECKGDNSRVDCARFPHLVEFIEKFCPGNGVSRYLEDRKKLGERSYCTFTDDRVSDCIFDRVLVRTGTEFISEKLVVPENVANGFGLRGNVWQVPPFYTS